MKKCIIYFPFKIQENHPSASNIRPIKIVEGFKELGYSVDVIKGYADERKATIKNIKKNIKSGEIYDFVYMESSTEPTLLTESHHIPTHPFLDFRFLKFCRSKNIKVGLFYRDIHWRFEQYKKSVSFYKRVVAYTFYYYDLIKYKRCIDVLYIPSLKMNKYIPIKLDKPVLELPSGCEEVIFESYDKTEESKLSILYVGGLSKELYNIEYIVRAVSENENFIMNICCRQDDWEKNKIYYEKYLNNRIKVIHKKDKELDRFAMNSDILSLVVEPTPYWEFAMPMKLFSYIAYGKPIIGVKNTACGDFIENNSIGYVVEYKYDEIVNILKYIEKNYKYDYNKKQKGLSQAFENNTWKSRANTVVNSLYKK